MRNVLRRSRTFAALLVILIVTIAAAALAQFRGFGLPPNPPYDGAFQYCRGAYTTHPRGDGGGWTTDYPQADENLPFRFSELTKASPSRDARGRFNHVIVTLSDERLYRCPVLIMQEVGALYLEDDDAAHLRDYLLKGGFLWVDDFWGEYAWRIWDSQIRKALPEDRFPLIDIPVAHPMFHMSYDVNGVAQIPSINVWLGTGQTSAPTAASRTPGRFWVRRIGYWC